MLVANINQDDILLRDILDEQSYIFNQLKENNIFTLSQFLSIPINEISSNILPVYLLLKDLYLDEPYELNEKIFNKVYNSYVTPNIELDDDISEIRNLLLSLGFGSAEIKEIIQNYISNFRGISLFDYILKSTDVYLTNYKKLLLSYYLKVEQRKRKQNTLISELTCDSEIFNYFLNNGITTNAGLIEQYRKGLFKKEDDNYDEINQIVRFLNYECYGVDLKIEKICFEQRASVESLKMIGFSSKQIQKIISHISVFEEYLILDLLKKLSDLNIEYNVPKMAIVLLNYYSNKYTLVRLK